MARDDIEPFSIAGLIGDTDRKAAAELKDAFHSLCLPVPLEHECLARRHGDYLVPLSFAGCTLQLTQTSDATPPIRHKHILQPLGEIRKGGWRIRIMPGVFLKGDDDQCRSLRALLRQDGIAFHDDVVANMGNLPVKTSEFPEGIPVVIDHNAFTVLAAFDPSRYREEEDAQHRLYDGLRKELAEAMAKGNPEAMRDFWKSCEASRHGENGTEPALVSGWQLIRKQYGDDRKSMGVREIATQYATSVHRYWRILDKEKARPASTGFDLP